MNSRMNRAIQQIRLIGNLSDKRHYSYSEDQVEFVRKTLDKEVKNIMERFSLANKKNDKNYFNIDDLKK